MTDQPTTDTAELRAMVEIEDESAYCFECGSGLSFEEMEFGNGLCITCRIDAARDEAYLRDDEDWP